MAARGNQEAGKLDIKYKTELIKILRQSLGVSRLNFWPQLVTELIVQQQNSHTILKFVG